MKLGLSFSSSPLALPNSFELYLFYIWNGQFNAQMNFDIWGDVTGKKTTQQNKTEKKKKRICWGYSCAFGFDLLPTSLFNN